MNLIGIILKIPYGEWFNRMVEERLNLIDKI